MSDYRLQKISTSFEVGAQELKAFKTKDPVLRQEILKQFHHKKQGPTKTQSISYLNHFCACRMCKKASPKKGLLSKKTLYDNKFGWVPGQSYMEKNNVNIHYKSTVTNNVAS